MMEPVPIPRRTAGVALACFILLGLPAGALGVAWPGIRASFGLPLAALGGLILPQTVSYLLCGAASGHLIGRLGLKSVLVGAVASFVVGLGVLAASPVWWLLPAGTTVLGMGGGALDATLNSFVTTHAARRLLGLLHGAYSAGGALGPLLVVSVVAGGASWRGAYAILAVVALVLSIVTASIGGWRLPPAEAADGSPVEGPEGSGAPQTPGPRARLTARGLWPVLLLSLGAFFVYTGTEISAGQWTYTFLIGSGGLDMPLAAAAVSGFWWGQTLVRAVSGFISVRTGPDLLIYASLAAALVGAAALWWIPNDAVRFGAVVLFGAGLGPLFPTLISLAPAMFGSRAVEVVGYQVAAAAVGGSAVVALTGLALQEWGLYLLPATLFAGVAATLALHRAGSWLAGRPAVDRLTPEPSSRSIHR